MIVVHRSTSWYLYQQSFKWKRRKHKYHTYEALARLQMLGSTAHNLYTIMVTPPDVNGKYWAQVSNLTHISRIPGQLLTITQCQFPDVTSIPPPTQLLCSLLERSLHPKAPVIFMYNILSYYTYISQKFLGASDRQSVAVEDYRSGGATSLGRRGARDRVRHLITESKTLWNYLLRLYTRIMLIYTHTTLHVSRKYTHR